MVSETVAMFAKKNDLATVFIPFFMKVSRVFFRVYVPVYSHELYVP